MAMNDIIGMNAISFQRLVSGIKLDIASKVFYMLNKDVSVKDIQTYFQKVYHTLYINQDISYKEYLAI